MPQVPYEMQSRVQATAAPNARVSTEAPIAAFGGGEQVAGVTNEVSKIAMEEKQKADHFASMVADGKLSDLETQIQIKTSQMKGKDALGATDYASEAWKKGVDNISSDLSGQDQRDAVARSSIQRWDSLNKNVQTHTAQQADAFADQETEGYIANSRNAAVLNSYDDQRINQELGRQTSALDLWAARKGIPQDSDIYKNKFTMMTSQTNKEVIGSRIDAGMVTQARKYFEDNKNSMTAADIEHATKNIESAETIGQSMAAWDQVKDMKLADGNSNVAKMQSTIMGMDIPDKKKQELFSYVHAQATLQDSNKNRAEAANERSFMDDAIAQRQSGAPIEKALMLVPKYGSDAYDQSIKQAAIQKLYAPTSTSDPQTFISMYERVNSEGATKEEIDKLMQDNKLNVADWRSLREDFYKANVEGRDEQHKYAWERVNTIANEQFGSDRDGKSKYIYDLHLDSRGKTPEEIVKMASDKLTKEPNTGWFGSTWFEKQVWESDMNRKDAYSKGWGKAYEDVGKTETLAIGKGALYGGKEQWGLSDVDTFAQAVGGYDAIKKGQPANNAMQSLIKRNQLVTPANIKAVLERYPEGNY